MNKLVFIAACTLCFVAGTLVPITHAHAQSSEAARTFYQLSFMKSRPGQDSLKLERELWKPVATELVNSGHINSWKVLEPMFTGAHPYDYMIIEEANDIDRFVHTDYNTVFTKVWGKDKIHGNSEQTEKARDFVGDEIWEVVDGVSKQVK